MHLVQGGESDRSTPLQKAPRPLTAQDLETLEILSRWVRVLSQEQLGKLLAPSVKDPLRAARRWVKKMEQHGLVESYQVVASEPCAPEELLRSSVHEASTPDFVGLSAKLRSRWTSQPRLVAVVRLGTAGAQRLGVKQPRRVRASEATHDLQLAEVALGYRASGLVTSWMSEDVLVAERKFHTVMPDALVTFSDGSTWAVEGGGSSYSAKKLMHFHETLLPQLEVLHLAGYILA